MTFDERKFVDYRGTGDDPPSYATADEAYLLRKYKGTIAGRFDRFELGIEPEVRQVLEPQSEALRGYAFYEYHLAPSRHFKRFNLFDETHFVDFAMTRVGDTESAIALANRFGPLGSGVGPEYVENWSFSISEMRQAVKKWERAKETRDFASIIQAVSFRTASLDQGKIKIPAPRIDSNIYLLRDRVTGEPRLCIWPTTLMNALWTQLALAVSGLESLHTCVECKRWFTIKSGQGRSDKIYCSDACRMRTYRANKKVKATKRGKVKRK
jgi:hypothetical protein